MKKTITGRHPRVLNWLVLTVDSRLFALVAGIMLAAGCHAGVDTPVAPSAIGTSQTAGSGAAEVVLSDDAITVQAAPVSYAMDQVDGSGYSGTCTVSSTHTGGFRLKADGQGTPSTLIRFNLVDVSASALYRTTAYAEVNQQGAFRTGWDVFDSTTFPAGHVVECWLTPENDSSVILAKSPTFQAP